MQIKTNPTEIKWTENVNSASRSRISVQFTLVATQRELDRVIFGGKCVNKIVVFVILFRL